MKNIYILLGKSASGKDSVLSELVKRFRLKQICYYTTRPRRNNEIEGQEYYFLNDFSEDELCSKNIDKTKIIEKREYNTIKGNWVYFTVFNNDFKAQEDGIIALPPKAFDDWVKSPLLKEYNIIPIYIHVDDKTRLLRSIERDSKQDYPNYAETCRRFLSDAEDFSGRSFPDKFTNNSLDECIEEIAKVFNFKKRA